MKYINNIFNVNLAAFRNRYIKAIKHIDFSSTLFVKVHYFGKPNLILIFSKR